MSLTQSVVKKLPESLQVLMIRMLYLKNKKKMHSMKRYFNNNFFIYEVDGYFIPSESIGWFVSYDYYYDWVNTLSTRAYKPKSGDIILDIGAGIGEESLVLSKMVGITGKVFSIEANPQAFSILTEIVNLNKLTNVSLHQKAISNEDGPVFLNVTNNNFLAGTVSKENNTGVQFKVMANRMDSFIRENNIERIDLLKTNIEGAERFVVDSLGNEINKIRNVAISCHDFRYKNENNIFYKTREIIEKYLLDNNFELSCSEPASNGFTDWVYGKNKRQLT